MNGSRNEGNAGALARPSAAPRRRRHTRGLTAITSLFFLFVFGLGQVSLVATAEELTEPVATEDSTVTEDPLTEDTTAEETATEDTSTGPTHDTALEGATGETTGDEAGGELDAATAGSEASVDDEASTEAATDDATPAADAPGPASGDGVQPLLVGGNPSCLDVMASGDFLFEHKQDPPRDATIALTYEDLSGTLTISVNESAQTFDFTFSGDFVAAGVIVKGGSNANFYDYRPDGNAADTGLHAPVNPMNGQFYGLSHISFCITEAPAPEPGIDVAKSCPETAAAGEEIEYTITVENTGTETLVDLSVEDSLFGDITDEFDPDLGAGLAVGATATATLTRTPGPNEDPVTNTVIAEGVGEDTEAEASDTATCETDIIAPAPAIQIVKGGPALVHRGDTIMYQFEVTNTGDVELFDVELTDPRCDEGTIVEGVDVDASLAVEEVWHFTCTHLVTDSDPNPLSNTATVTADTEPGEGGQEVTDQDDHVVDIIHPAISIVKTVSDDSVAVGTTVTYTYVVTNTGDTTLFEISVDDDILGHIGIIAMLEPGDHETLTATFTVGASPVLNVGTAIGEDVLGETVTDTDDALVTPVAGTGGGGPNPGEGPRAGSGAGGTAFTGSDVWTWALLAAALSLIGGAALAATRKGRRAQGSA